MIPAATALQQVDVAVSELIVDLRWRPLTAVMMALSVWWLKDLLAVAIVTWADVRRGRLPWRAGLVALSTMAGSGSASLLKGLVHRQRPFAQHLWSGLGPLPRSGSMPSGHASTAFAAAVALGLVMPAARRPALAVAAAICLSRVYLGVHFVSDVVAGALLGTAVAWACVAGTSAAASAAAARKSGPHA